jgi:predicted PurR-regulated permease PerM
MDSNQPSVLPNWSSAQVALATLFIVGVALAFWLLIRFSQVIFLLFIAVVISTAITPGVAWLHKRGMSRAVGILLIYLLLLLLVIGFFMLLAPMIVEQGADIGGMLPNYYQSARDWLLRSPSLLVRRVALELPRNLPWTVAQPVEPPLGAGEVNGEDAQVLNQVGQVMAFTGLVSRSLFNSAAVFLLAFYWTLENERIIRTLLLILPNRHREGARDFIAEVQERVGGYIRGVILLSIIVGGMALVAYLFIGLPYALSLALITAVFEAVPIIGPALGAIPALLVAFGTGDTFTILAVLAAVIVIQLMENTIFGPRVMQRSVHVNPILTLLALATFTSLLGIAGALLAVPIAAVFQLVLEKVVRRATEKEEDVPQERDALSALRLELKELSSDVRKHLREKEIESAGDEEEQIEERIEAIAEDLDRLLGQGRGSAEVPERVNP